MTDRDNINRIHERIDGLDKKVDNSNESIKQLTVQITRIATTVENQPEQPCIWHNELRKDFDAHVNERQQITHDWKRALINNAVSLLRYTVIAVAGFIVGKTLFG